MRTSLYTSEIPQIFLEFRDAINEKYWKNRVREIKNEIRGNKFLESYLIKENELAFSLNELSTIFHNQPSPQRHLIERNEFISALTFAVQVLDLLKEVNNQSKNALTRRVQGGFNNPVDLRALTLELSTTINFINRGYEISWPEMNETGRYDLFAESDVHQLEVECKLITANKGRKIHRREAIEFFSNIYKEIKYITKNLNVGLSVVITFPDRMPTAYKDKKILVKLISDQIILGQSEHLENGMHIDIKEYDSELINNIDLDENSESLRDGIDDITNTINREGMIFGDKGGSNVVMALKSKKDDTFLDAINQTLSESAKKQLTGTRPAILVIRFEDLTNEQIQSIAESDIHKSDNPSALQIKVSEFLNNPNRDHVVLVIFVSKDELSTKDVGVKSNSGVAYYFPNTKSPFWDDSIKNVYRIPDSENKE